MDVFMETKLENYSCGHSVKAVIINMTEESLATYFEWKESKTTSCLSCWNKHKNKNKHEA